MTTISDDNNSTNKETRTNNKRSFLKNDHGLSQLLFSSLNLRLYSRFFSRFVTRSPNRDLCIYVNVKASVIVIDPDVLFMNCGAFLV